jgi:chlorobactene glucosyltransferase
MLRDAYLVVLVCVNAYFLATVVANIAYFRIATRKPRVTRGPFVSVIVPARNEERSIARCVGSLVAQGYEGFEVIVVDDGSTDRTAQIVAELAADHSCLHLVHGTPLPDGWFGKPHALSQGAAVARGEVLMFTDADTVHDSQSISWAVTNLQDHAADFVSGYLDQEYGSLGESIVVPTMYAAMLLVPFFLLPRTKSAGLAFAIGQYVAVRREALDDVGGFEAIRDSIVDDMSMAARLKELGHRGVFLDAKGVASCRLYDGYRDAFTGIQRSIYSALGGSVVAAVVVTGIVLGLIVWPALSVLVSSVRLETTLGPLAVSVALFAIQWALVTWDRNVPLSAFVLYPLVFLDLVLILIASMLTTGLGPGVDWKGRLVRASRRSDAARAERLAELASRSGKVR